MNAGSAGLAAALIWQHDEQDQQPVTSQLQQWHLYRRQRLPAATVPRQQCVRSSERLKVKHAWQLGTQSQAEEPQACLPGPCHCDAACVSVSCCLPAHRRRWAG